jgi:hypothetical protein
MLPDDDWFLKTAQTALHKLQLVERKHQEEQAYTATFHPAIPVDQMK